MGFIEKMLRWIVIGGLFLVPTIVLILADGVHFPYNLFFPYITGKNFVFRVLVELVSAAWLALALTFPRYRPRRSWLLGAFALFVLLIAIADAQGAYPFKSFWSNYERMDGWVTVAHTFLLFLVAACVLDSENLWRRLFQWSLGISALVSLMGLLQIANVSSVGSGGTGLGARVDATFGNPIYFAAYMLFHVFLAALLWYQTWQVRGSGKRLWPSLWYGAVIVLDTATLLFSGTRGATLGLIIGGYFAFLLYVLAPEGKQMRNWAIASLAVLLIAAGGLYVGRDTALVQKVGFLNRLASLISLQDDTTHARLLNMGIAWQGVKERPLLGWGQENYAVVFDKYYDPRMYGQEQWFDRVHNIIFDWWVAGGTLGLLSYLSIFAALFWVLWRKSVFAVGERSILAGLVVGYVIHNMTVFDNVTSYILFAMVLGYVAYREGAALKAQPIFETSLIPSGMLSVSAAGAALLFALGAWWVNANALTENLLLIGGLSPHPAGIGENLTTFKRAIALGTYGTQEAREQLGQIAMQVAGSNTSVDLKVAFVEEAVKQLDLQSQLSPLDARFPLFAGAVLDSAGDYKDANIELARAHQLSPGKQSILFELAANSHLRGDTQGELDNFKTAFNLDTDDLDARLYYAAALITAGQESEADQVLGPVISSGAAADQRIVAAYASRGEYAKLIPLFQARIQAQPSDLQAYFTLAAVYYQAHDSASAIAELQTVEQVAPSAKAQAERYIQQIRLGTISIH